MKTVSLFLLLTFLGGWEQTAVQTPELTIARLYAGKAGYAGKTVRIKGKVVKYNANIMGKNWVHLQDGTDHEGKNDLTVTTTMKTEVGKEITVEGVVVLDKDLGAGYYYELLLEEARILDNR